MGRGSSTKQRDVVKHLENLKTTAGEAGNQPDQDIESCLFSFKLEVQLKTKQIIQETKVGLPAALVRNSSSGEILNIFIGGFNVGTYNGSLRSRLVNCIKDGYVYEGQVVAISKNDTGIIVTLDLRGGEK